MRKRHAEGLCFNSKPQWRTASNLGDTQQAFGIRFAQIALFIVVSQFWFSLKFCLNISKLFSKYNNPNAAFMNDSGGGLSSWWQYLI